MLKNQQIPRDPISPGLKRPIAGNQPFARPSPSAVATTPCAEKVEEENQRLAINLN